MSSQVFKYTYPPFPCAPEGANIVSFKDFKDLGIMLEAVGDVEVDGYGVPTVQLKTSHDTDNCKSNTKRKRIEVMSRKGGKEAPIWWETWAEMDMRIYPGSFSPYATTDERVRIASDEFQNDRFKKVPQEIQLLFDQFRLYIGLLFSTATKGKKKKFSLERDDNDVSDDEIVDDDEPHVNTPDDELDDKMDKLSVFLRDIPKQIQIFLTSYSIEQGLIWTRLNLTSIPKILKSYLTFILKRKALVGSKYEHDIAKALDFVAQAEKELPFTEKLANVLPDEFSICCVSCFGSKADGAVVHMLEDVKDEPEAKRQKVENAEEVNVEEMETTAEAEEVIKVGAWDGGVEPDSADPGAWGNEDWGHGNSEQDDGWGGASDNELRVESTAWALPSPHSLMADVGLGPTNLPNTHTPGVVESSVRRIKSVAKPRITAPPKASNDAEAVENELDVRFAKLVLSPWTETGHGSPRLLESSTDSGLVKHDCEKDDIIVLVEEKVLESVIEGMGIEGVWVQLARDSDFDVDDGKKKKKVQRRFWYVNTVVFIFTGLHAPMSA